MVYQYFDFNYFFVLAEQLGVLTFLLPFLLIFSVVYSVLLRIDIFQKVPMANVIVSLVIAFFALTNYYISFYMQRLFSNLAIAIVIFIAILVLFGLFNVDISKGGVNWLFVGIGLIALIVILIKTFSPHFEFALLPYLQFVLPLIIIIIAIVLIVLFTSPTKGESPLIFKVLKGK